MPSYPVSDRREATKRGAYLHPLRYFLMKFERTQFGKGVLIALAIEGLLTAFVFSKDIRLGWDHNGTCQTGSQECPISYYKIYLIS